MTAKYHAATNAVTLMINGTKNPFSKGGGRLTILASSEATGVSSQAGVLLNAKYTVFSIASDATGINLG